MQPTILNNRYRLDAQVGEGGMAVVYRGYDLLLRRQIAVKLLREPFASDQAFVARFYEEAQAAANLSHPNIVSTYDVGECDGKPYIVQEFVPGETLATLIGREHRLPEAAAVRYARQICGALVAAHRQELLHRDIKPSNVLITPEDVVRVADFGIARAAGRGAIADGEDVLGSVPYCSPEQISGDSLTEASDLYSLGAVLYETVTGNRPYGGDSAADVAAAHLNAPVPDPASVAPVSPELRAVIRRLLQKNPRDRFQSAGEALAALRRCASDETSALNDARSSGPDSPTALLKRAAAAGAGPVRARSGDDFELAPARWRSGRAVGIAAAIVGIVVVIALLLAEERAYSRSMRVPDLSGKTVADAAIQLQTLGVNVSGVRLHSDPNTDAGLVDGSDPALDARIDRGASITLLVSSGPPTVPTPSVVGEDLKLAMDTLTANGFDVRVGTAVHSNSVRAGAVAQTRPAPGSPVPAKGTIVLLPSAGPQLVTVPSVVDLIDSDAQRQLQRLGLKLRINQVISDATIPAHTVIDQEPPDGASVAPGSTITVDVSGGAANIAVPNLVGGTVDDARNSLNQVGLALGTVAQAEMADTTPGTVVSQNPAAGSAVGQGQPVDVVVAVAPGNASSPGPTPSSAAAPTAAPTATGAPQALQPIPNVRGMTVDQARAALAAAGYVVSRVTLAPGSPSNARVITTEPAAGATTPPGSNAVVLILGAP